MLLRAIESDAAGASLEYILGLIHLAAGSYDYRHPLLVAGNAARLKALIASSPYREKLCAVILGYEEEVDDDTVREDVDGALGVLLPGIPKTEYAYVAGRHHELAPWTAPLTGQTFRTSVHLDIGTTHLPTDRRLQPFFFGADKPRVEAWAELTNLVRGYSSPKDPDRIRWGSQARDMPVEERCRGLELRRAIDQLVAAARARGLVSDGPSLLAYLRQEGFPHAFPMRDLHGQTGLSLVVPKLSQPLPLVGPHYNHDYPTLKRKSHVPNLAPDRAGRLPHATLYPGGYLARDDASRARLATYLAGAIAERAALNQALYARSNSRMGAPLLARDAGGPWRYLPDLVQPARTHDYEAAGGPDRAKTPDDGAPEAAHPAPDGGDESGQGRGGRSHRPAAAADSRGGARLAPGDMGRQVGRNPPESRADGGGRQPLHGAWLAPTEPDAGRRNDAAAGRPGDGSLTPGRTPVCPARRWTSAARPGPTAVTRPVTAEDESDTAAPDPAEPFVHPRKLKRHLHALLARLLASSRFTAAAGSFGAGALCDRLVSAAAKITRLAAGFVRAMLGAAFGPVERYVRDRAGRERGVAQGARELSLAGAGLATARADLDHAAGRVGKEAGNNDRGICATEGGAGLGAGPAAATGGRYPRIEWADPGLKISARGLERLHAAVTTRDAMRESRDAICLVPPAPPPASGPDPVERAGVAPEPAGPKVATTPEPRVVQADWGPGV